LEENGLGKEGIAMYRLVDYKWIELPTTFESEDDDSYIYSSETPYFSYFIIGQKASAVVALISEEVESVAEETLGTEGITEETEIVEEPLDKTLVWVGASVGALILLVVVALVIWLVKRKKPKKKERKRKK